MSGAPLDIRGYQGRQDLAPLLAFASRSFAARAPLNGCWHPGDILWELKPDYDRPHRVRMWLSGEDIVAVTMFPASNQLWLEIHPDFESDLPPDIIARAERSATRAAQSSLSIRALENDTRRTGALEALGYTQSGPESVCFRIDLTKDLPAAPLPAGYRLRDSIGIDAAARAKAHRDAWDDLSEIGLPDARSTFFEDVYRGLAAAPGYDPSLDILVVAPDGTLAANAVCWADAASGIAVFEPVGTHAQFRKRGLTKLAMQEALRRVKARGHREARVSTAHFNKPAIAAYTGAGFTLYDRWHWWTKPLA
ncbi:MAG: GNAT family N-acetyltransferase [Alphaproteobacteria bacterium]|nr:GNAT family N-acetyltransferase [Alphaproteobacteria bacterium]